MLIIGVDIDDTLTNTTLFANNILKASGIDNLEDYHDLEQVAFNEFIKKNIKRIQRDVTLKDDAKEVLDWFKRKGIVIKIITARGSHGFEELVPITLNYLNEKGIPYDKILFFQENKAESCLAESVDVFIDDKERVLDEIAKLGIKTLIFSEKKETSKHQVVSSWKEVKNYILKHYL